MLKRYSSTLLALTFVGASTMAQADTILGLTAGAGSWQSNYSGEIGDSGADLETLGYTKTNQNFYYVSLEHPVPIIPNLRLQHTELKSSATGTGELTIKGNTVSGTITSELDLTHTDAILYYEILDNWVSLDLGVNLRNFDVELMATDGSQSARTDANGVVPMLYGMAQFDLPLSGFSMGASASAIAISDSTVSDLSANIRYTSSLFLDLGVELGYRSMTVKLEESEKLNTDIEIKGPYLSAQLHF